MTRDRCRYLDRLSLLWLDARDRRDAATLAALWAIAEADADWAAAVYALAAELDVDESRRPESA